MTAYQPERFQVGAAIGKTFEVMFQNVVPFGIMALLMTLPMLASNYVAYDLMFQAQQSLFDLNLEPTQSKSSGPQELLFNLLNLVLYALAWTLSTATMSFGTYEALRGRQVGIDECLKRGLPLVVPALVVSTLFILGVGVASVALLVPGIIVAMVWYVVVPVAVVEGPGVLAAFGRSADLTRGNRWRLFGINIISVAISWALNIPVFLAVLIFFGDALVLSGIVWVTTALSLIFSAVMTAVVYYYLRLAREGGSIEDIAAVFD